MKNHIFLFFVSVCILIVSCEKEVILDFKHEPRLCLNCILNPDSTVNAKLTLSRSLDKNGDFETVNNAQLVLYEENKQVGVLKPLGNGKYILDKKPEKGKTYKIVAEADNYPLVSGTTTVPFAPEIDYSKEMKGFTSYDSTRGVFDLHIRLNDKPGKDNYWIYENWVVNDIKYGGSRKVINSPYVDDFNKAIDTEAKYGFTLFLGIHLTDEGCDGETMDFILLDFVENTPSNCTEKVSFLNADEHYSKYLKTTILTRFREVSDLPFFEPVQMYSNINEGYGIFGSCSETNIKL